MQTRKWHFYLFVFVATMVFAGWTAVAGAKEVNKNEIPTEHLAKSCKALPWGVAVWDIEEAIPQMNDSSPVLWVDTRPDSFYKQGSVRGAVRLAYGKSGEAENELNKDKLEAALKAKGLAKDTAKIAFFCQGPTCHRSYNAAFVAVTQWGFNPKNIMWFRDGYPVLFKEVKENPQLKRKAKAYLTEEALGEL